jgi:MFS family permease
MNDMPEDAVPAPFLELAPDPRRWIALVVLLTGAFLPTFDFFVVNVALPAMHSELAARPADLELVVAGYGLAFAVLLVTGGRLGDLYGRKKLFIIGMAGFTFASALCGLATSPAVLIASRVLQGLTAALLNPQVLAIIRVTFPEHERARAIGYFGTTIGVASIAAQLIGGGLVQADLFGLSWRPIFLVNIPVGAVAMYYAVMTLRDSRADGCAKLDPGGIALATLFLLLLAYPLVEGRGAGWPGWMVACLVASVPALALFVFYEWTLQARGQSPLVNLRLFRDPAFSLGLFMAATFFGGLAAFFLGLTVFLQQGLGYGPFPTGLVFLAFGLGFAGTSLLSAQLSRRIGPRAISVGTAMMATGLMAIVWLACAAHGGAINLVLLWPVLLYYGCGQGFALPTLVSSVVGSGRIPPQEAGSASGLFAMVQQTSFALGVAVIMGLFFAVLGAGTTPGDYERALSVALECNAGLMALTCGLAFLLPRRAVRENVVVHIE